MRPWLLAAVPLLPLAGCAHSPPTRLLALEPAPPAAVRSDYRGPPLAVPAVHLPALLDRAEYVHGDGAGTVKVNDFARWAAPLGLLARDTLVRDLSARLPEGAVLPPGSAGGGSARTLNVTVVSFGSAAGGAHMEAAWRVLPNGRVHQVSLTDAGPYAGSDPAGAARAFSQLLGQLADRIAASAPDG